MINDCILVASSNFVSVPKAIILSDIKNMYVDHLFCIFCSPSVSEFTLVTYPIVSGDSV